MLWQRTNYDGEANCEPDCYDLLSVWSMREFMSSMAAAASLYASVDGNLDEWRYLMPGRRERAGADEVREHALRVLWV